LSRERVTKACREAAEEEMAGQDYEGYHSGTKRRDRPLEIRKREERRCHFHVLNGCQAVTYKGERRT